jgi:hypothetical protein
MKYKITAVAINKETRKTIGKPRTETIDTNNNVLFENCVTPFEIEKAYESFWNDVPTIPPKEIVKVINVE